MGRRPDPQKRKLRKEALRLEQKEDLNARQIAERMGVKVSTAQYWLQQERGSRTPFKVVVRELLDKGETDLTKIAALAGTGYENVRKIEREWRGYLKRQHRSGEQMVADFLANPRTQKNAEYTTYRTFGRAMVDECKRATRKNPKQALRIIELAESQFAYIRKRVRDPENLRLVGCNISQVIAVKSGRARLLSENKTEREKALQILLSARRLNPDCLACDADLARRESIILRDLKKFDEALERLGHAELVYHDLGNNGHDRFKNGVGSCALERITIFNESGQPDKAIAVAEMALRDLVRRSEEELHFLVRFNHARGLVEIPARAREARSAIAGLLEEIDGGETSLTGLHLAFLAGRASEGVGDRKEALNHYESAYEYALELEISAALSALEADIARLMGNSELFKDRIGRLRNLNADGEPADFPSWMAPISEILEDASKMAAKDFRAALEFLRREGGGDEYFPILAVAG